MQIQCNLIYIFTVMPKEVKDAIKSLKKKNFNEEIHWDIFKSISVIRAHQ